MADDDDIVIGVSSEGTEETGRDLDKLSEGLGEVGKSADELAQEAFERIEKKADDLGDEIDDLIDDLESGSDAVDGVGDSMDDTGKKAGGLMGWLRGVAGQMLSAISVASILNKVLGFIQSSISDILQKQRQTLDDAAQRGPQIVRTTQDYADALADVPSKAQSAANALSDYYSVVDENVALTKQQAADAIALANARKAEAEALIDLRQAEGQLTADEAQEEKRLLAIDSRIEKHKEELKVLLKIEEAEKRKAEAAQLALDAANQREEEAAQDVDDFAGAGGDRARGEIVDPELERRARELFTEMNRARRELEELESLMGKNEAGAEVLRRLQEEASLFQRLNPVSAATRLLTAHLEVKDQIAQSEAEVERLADEYFEAAEELDRKIDEEGERRRNRLQEERESQRQAQEEVERQGQRAERASGDVERKQTVDQEVLDRTNNADQTRNEAERVRREREEQRRREQEQADQEAASIARDIESTVATARSGTPNQALVETLREVAKMLADGTDGPELATVQSRLATAVSQAVGLTERTRALLQQTNSRLNDLDARFRASQG